MKKTWKKVLAVLCVLALTCMMLAGCTGGNTTDSTSTPADSTVADSTTSDSTTTSATGVEMTAIIATSWDNAALEACIAKYKEETGNTITLEVVPDDQLTDLITLRLSTGSDVPDLYFGNKEFTDQQVTTFFTPLDGASWIDNLNEDHVKYTYSNSIDGKVYQAPYGGASCLGLMYNKDILAEVGVEVPILTYADLMDACEKIKAAGYTPFSISSTEGWTEQILATGNQYIAVMSEDEQKALVAGEMSYADMAGEVELFSNMKAILDNGYVNDDYMSTTMDMSIEDVATGECAFTPAGDWSYNPMIEAFPDSDPHVGMIPSPMYQDMCYVNIGTSSKPVWVPADATNKDAAIDFVNWFMSEEGVQTYYDLEPGICPQNCYTVNSNTWDAEMNEYSKTLPLAQTYPTISGFSMGDFAGTVNKLFTGYSVEEALNFWYDDCKQTNIAAGTTGFAG